jgi:WD40 repeat protein
MPNKDYVSLGITLRQTLRGHSTVIEQIGWSPNGRMLASASGNVDKTIRLWDPQTGKCLKILVGHTA